MNDDLTNDLKTIKILPEHIIDQIKAGEVIERPSLLIKELVENSIDAGASKIEIGLVENGLNLISIEDNGKGMSFEDAPYAFLRHATSKIDKFEDLYHLHSFGFRGEALASIAAISRLTCITQPKNLKRKGAKIILNAGVEELCIPQQADESGTKIFIKDLFYNTPARLKFIKSKSSEKIAFKKILQAFLLSNPTVEFNIKWDDEDKEIYRPKYTAEDAPNNFFTDNEMIRVSQIFFNKKEKVSDLVRVENEFDGYKVHGYFSRTSTLGNAHKQQFLFINNRLFYDKTLHQGVIRNLERFWPQAQTGHYVFFIQAPTQEIDVNVHPNKTQIKFLKPDIVYTLIMAGIKDSLLKEQKKHDAISAQSTGENFLTMIDLEEQKHHQLQSFENTFDRDHHPKMSNQFTYEPSNYNSSASSFLNQDEHADESTVHQPFQLFEKWMVYTSELGISLINRHDFFLYRLQLDYLGWLKENDHPSFPLLISEPLRGLVSGLNSNEMNRKEIDSVLELLKKYGLEIEFLDKDFLVLRTSPNFLLPSHAPLLAKILIQIYLSKKDIHDFFEWKKISEQFTTDLQNIILGQNPENDFFKITHFPVTELLEKKILLLLDNARLSSLFEKIK